MTRAWYLCAPETEMLLSSALGLGLVLSVTSSPAREELCLPSRTSTVQRQLHPHGNLRDLSLPHHACRYSPAMAVAFKSRP